MARGQEEALRSLLEKAEQGEMPHWRCLALFFQPHPHPCFCLRGSDGSRGGHP